MNKLFALWAGFKKSYKARAEHSKQPLNRENAYAISILGKEGTYKNVLDDHKKWLLTTVKEEAKMGNSYLLWRHLNKITPAQRKELVAFLSELDYQVLYTDDNVVLITWLKND